ncbi:MAG: glycosyltransferase family 2 protein [Actinomycetes bacterium]
MGEPPRSRGTDQPLVTVVIPAWNAAELIGPTIESACAQTHPRTEVLVVDDGSSDATADLARSFGPPVRVVEQEHRGTAAACNTGFSAARGSVIALLRPGDRWAPTLIERCLERLGSDPRAGLVTTDYYELDGTNATERRGYDGARGRGMPERDAQRAAIACCDVVSGPSVFDRRLLDLVGGGFAPDLGAAAPHELWTRFLLANTEFVLIPEALAWCRPPEPVPDQDRLAGLERHLPSLWLRGAHGRPQDAYAIAGRVAARGERRLALWFIAHSLTDAGANPAQRVRFALGGVRLLLTARRPGASTREPAA